LAVCDGFVTPALSLGNCSLFVSRLLVPKARALTSPASRVLVTAVSGVAKARPGAVIEGLVLPLLCEGDPALLGSAQCELCLRLIKQVLPKYTLDSVLYGLCSLPSGGGGTGSTSGVYNWAAEEGMTGGGELRGGQERLCVWTELTVPVVMALLNLKPSLSDKTVAQLVRRIEVASEQPELQTSLKFTTLIHILVTRFGPQSKPHVTVLRTSTSRCSTFMVKAVQNALQRL
ncbi:unnamed protein product, partial [Choristocarpus tenellus]